MENSHGSQSQPQAAHAQPVDPVADALQGVAEGEPEQEPASGSTRLQEVLPEIKELAQKVGGMKRLAEIAETLQQAEG
jgi:hypothetical protein